jgi:hypothetical protein
MRHSLLNVKIELPLYRSSEPRRKRRVNIKLHKIQGSALDGTGD